MEEIAGVAGSSEGRRRPRPGGEAKASAVPACYHRPSAGSCHHACKYGGAHAFEEREPRRPAAAQPRPHKQQQQQQPATVARDRTAPLAKLRSASSRRRVGDLTKSGKSRKPAVAAAADDDVVDDTGKKGDAGVVVWKDIVAYESSPLPPEKTTIAGGGGAAKKKDASVTKGKKPIKSSPHGKSKIVAESTEDVIAASNDKPDGSSSSKKKLIKSVGSKLTGKPPPSPELKAGEKATPPSHKNKKEMTTTRTNSLKHPKPKRNLVEISQQISHQNPSSSSSAAANDIKEEKPHNPPCQEEKKSGMAPPPSPPRPSHRRAKSMSITGSAKSVRFPFTRQASRTTATAFKVIRSRSSRAAATSAPPEDAPAPAPTRLRFFRRGDAGGSSSGGGGGSGFHLRMRSLRRRGSIGGTAAAAAGGGGFVVPAVVLRHQKTLEKKRSRRLYNSVIEETAGKLAIARKSKVKALVGAFESLISKIGKYNSDGILYNLVSVPEFRVSDNLK
uniref:Calmodulin-binding domain-containing protein n=1 Tax=Oryza meridionalis TaxID=40149 RepID=A0A0E0FCD9_9ORYZ